jgi:hypothetical protein
VLGHGAREKRVRPAASLLYGLRRKEKMGRGRKGPIGLKARQGEEGRFEEFFFSFFSNVFKLLSLNPFSNFSRFKLFSKIFKTI